MQGTFSGAIAFNQDINDWDTSSVTTLRALFNGFGTLGDSPFNQDLDRWDVSNVTDMSQTFRRAVEFNGDISRWDTSSVTSMFFMFGRAENFEQDISHWNVSSVTDFREFLTNSGLSVIHYDALLIRWSEQTLQANQSFYGGSSLYTPGGAAEAARNVLINTYNWTLQDDGVVNTSAIWNSGTSGNVSDSANWIGNPTLDSNYTLTIESGNDAIVWDSGLTTIDALSVGSSFTGTVSLDSGLSDATATSAVMIGGGELLTARTVTTEEYTQSSTGTLVIDIARVTEGSYGQINATGIMTLAGGLRITLSVTPDIGQSFDILNWGQLTHNAYFNDIQLPVLPAGQVWNLSQLYTSGVISIEAAPGSVPISPSFWIDASDPGSFDLNNDVVLTAFDKSGNNLHLQAVGAPRL